MDEPEFDRFAADYDRVLGNSIPGPLNEDGYFAEYKVALMAARMQGAIPSRVLDFGCGAGRSLPYIAQYFPDSEVWGYDVSPASLEVAAVRTPQARLFSSWNAIGDTRFDAIIAANVFHHIPPSERLPALATCRSALASGGRMFMFEHNPHNPVTSWIFERCAFDQDAEMLSLKTAIELGRRAGFQAEKHGYTMFFPRPLAFLRPLERFLRRIPMGAQYYVELAD